MIVIPSVRPFSVPSSMSDSGTFSTKKAAGTFGSSSTAYAASTTGYFKVEWWDGTSTQYGSGDNTQAYPFTKGLVSPYNTSAEKTFTIYSTDSAGKRKGYMSTINFISLSNSPISSFDVTKYRKLTGLHVTGAFSSYTHNPNIQNLTIANASITSLNLSNYFSIYYSSNIINFLYIFCNYRYQNAETKLRKPRHQLMRLIGEVALVFV